MNLESEVSLEVPGAGSEPVVAPLGVTAELGGGGAAAVGGPGGCGAAAGVGVAVGGGGAPRALNPEQGS